MNHFEKEKNVAIWMEFLFGTNKYKICNNTKTENKDKVFNILSLGSILHHIKRCVNKLDFEKGEITTP
jgi:hypothetical protein